MATPGGRVDRITQFKPQMGEMTAPIPIESLLPNRTPAPTEPRTDDVVVPIGPPMPVEALIEGRQRSRWGKKRRLLTAYLVGNPVWVTWQVTYNCHYRCSFCTYWQNDFKPHEENSLEDFARGARKLSQLGSLIVSLAGGEPLLRRDLHHIVRIMAQDHFPYLTTSGAGVTPKRARELWEAGLWGVSVSIDYADPEKHNHHRGIKFAYERALKAIEQLLEARVDDAYQRVQIISVLTNDNIEEMPRLCELARSLGIYWQVQPYSVMKTGNDEQRHLPGASEVLLDLKQRYPETFHTNRVYLEKFDEAINDGLDGCIAGRAMFNVDNQMVVSKCVEFNKSEPCGNLRTDSMQDVLGQLHEAHARNTCTACWYSCRGEVEVLYTARGFYHSMHSFLWQSRGQKEDATTGSHAPPVVAVGG
jgi:MoaA/NifB/PqqE/SkfB family radical SAM enzyme